MQYFLETIANGDSDLYEWMFLGIGYILNNDVKAKSFICLEGVGDAGKSRFCDLIASFFPQSGPNKVTRIAFQDLGGKFALGNLVNAKLNISEDLPFQHSIPREKQDRNIMQKIQGELPALFNYAFAAYRQLVASGYVWAGMERFTPDIRVVHFGLRTDKE